MGVVTAPQERIDTRRVADLRRRVREGMERPPVGWDGPARIDDSLLDAPLPVRKAHAIALKLAHMPTDLWRGQLFAGSMTLEDPKLHLEWSFPEYTTETEREAAASLGVSTRSVFGHIVPDYPRLLERGLDGIVAAADAQQAGAKSDEERAFLDSVRIACEGVIAYAGRLAERCERDASEADDPDRAEELRQMAANLRQAPGGPSLTFWQALQSVWLLHMVFHSTRNGNAMGRLDQYVGPYLERELAAGTIDFDRAGELVDCFCLKFNERAKTTDEQRPEERGDEPIDRSRRTRHYTSSQLGRRRDGLDATNHWLQNIVVGGLRPDGTDGTNTLSYLILESYRRNRMTNPLVTVRVHENTPDDLLRYACEVLKDGGGMPAFFSDEALVPAIERIGIPLEDARDYTNDGCWETIIPGRTDFVFQRLSPLLCLEWALNRGVGRFDGEQHGPDTGDPRAFATFDDVWRAFLEQLDEMVGRTVRRVVDTINNRSTIAPVPLLSALLDGPIEKRTDMTAGGAKYRTFGMIAESMAHAIDSLTAIQRVVFEDGAAAMSNLIDALDADFEGHEVLRAKLLAAPKYGNDDRHADDMGRRVVRAFTDAVGRHAEEHRDVVKFPCGAGTFSWYIGIGEGLGASPDGRRAGQPVSSNFSPALGRDVMGIPGAILSYSGMGHANLAVGGPLDLRVAGRLVAGDEGTGRLAAVVRSFVDAGGAMMTLTVADTEVLREAQRDPDSHRSLRVRMGGWCAYFTMLSREQQDHHIRRQEARS